MSSKFRATIPVAVAHTVFFCLVSPVLAGQSVDDGRPTAAVQAVVDELRAQLSISHAVTVAPVSSNARMMSVAPPAEAGRPFELAVDEGFLIDLTDEELLAALAHELGHVWVFTHHPYLQTERLANEIAMQVVSRESLERLYAKVWSHDSRKGDLIDFLGPPPTANTLQAAPAR